MVVVLMGLLVLAFFRAQVLRSTPGNSRPTPTASGSWTSRPHRGTIFDRNDSILADNVPGYSVILLPDQQDTIRARLERLRPHLGLSDGRIEPPHGAGAGLPPAASDGEGERPLRGGFGPGGDEAASSRAFTWSGGPGAGTWPGRPWPTSWVSWGRSTFRSWKTPAYAQDPGRYEPGDIVGKDGIERQYETRLQGVTGFRYVEVDVLGRIVGSVRGPGGEAPPLQGRTSS